MIDEVKLKGSFKKIKKEMKSIQDKVDDYDNKINKFF